MNQVISPVMKLQSILEPVCQHTPCNNTLSLVTSSISWKLFTSCCPDILCFSKPLTQIGVIPKEPKTNLLMKKRGVDCVRGSLSLIFRLHQGQGCRYVKVRNWFDICKLTSAKAHFCFLSVRLCHLVPAHNLDYQQPRQYNCGCYGYSNRKLWMHCYSWSALRAHWRGDTVHGFCILPLSHTNTSKSHSLERSHREQWFSAPLTASVPDF